MRLSMEKNKISTIMNLIRNIIVLSDVEKRMLLAGASAEGRTKINSRALCADS